MHFSSGLLLLKDKVTQDGGHAYHIFKGMLFLLWLLAATQHSAVPSLICRSWGLCWLLGTPLPISTSMSYLAAVSPDMGHEINFIHPWNQLPYCSAPCILQCHKTWQPYATPVDTGSPLTSIQREIASMMLRGVLLEYFGDGSISNRALLPHQFFLCLSCHDGACL